MPGEGEGVGEEILGRFFGRGAVGNEDFWTEGCVSIGDGKELSEKVVGEIDGVT